MIYRMSAAMYSELWKSLCTKGYFADEHDIVRYINDSFGLRVEIKEIQTV